MSRQPRQTVISRPHLVGWLKDSGRKVILAAPSGYGKTTLLVQLREELSRKGLDVALLDARDRYRHKDLEADVLLVDSINPNDFSLTCKQMDQWAAAKDGRRVFAATNSLPSGQPCEWDLIGEDELKFNEEEVSRLTQALSSHTASFPSEDPSADADPPNATLSAEQLLEKTDGWPLAVRMLILGESEMETARGLYQSIPPGRPRVMAALLARVDRVRPALLPLSMGVPESAATGALDELVDLGVAQVETEPRGAAYSLRAAVKPIFRGLSQVSPSVLEETRRVHALFEAAEHPLRSLETLLDVGDLASAETLVGRHFDHLRTQGPDTLAALRNRSLGELEEHPLLTMLRLVLERTQEEMPIATVERMARELQTRLLEDHAQYDLTRRAMLLGAQIAVDRMLGLWDSALALSHQAMDIFGDPKGQTDEELGELPPLLYTVIGLTGILGADYALAQEASNRGFRLASAQDNRLEKVQALALSALSSVLLGDVHEAIPYLERFEDLGGYEDLDSVEYNWVNELLARALVAFHTGKPDEGEKALQPVVPLMYRMEQWPIVAVVEAALARLIHGPYAAYRLLTVRLAQQPKSRPMPPIWQAQLHTQLAMQAVHLGRYSEAKKILEQLAFDLDLTEGTMLSHELAHAQLDLYSGQYQRVLDRLNALKKPETRSRRRAEFALLEALARYRLGDVSAIGPAFARVQTRDDRSSILSRFPHDLLTEAAERTGTQKYMEELDQVPEHVRSYQQAPLSEAEQRVLRLLAQGLTTAQAAEQLYVSVNTVKAHRRSIYRKLSATNREEAIVAARKRGLLT